MNEVDGGWSSYLDVSPVLSLLLLLLPTTPKEVDGGVDGGVDFCLIFQRPGDFEGLVLLS